MDEDAQHTDSADDGAEQLLGERGVGRRRLLKALGGSAAVGVGAVASFGVTTYNDRASARSRAYGAASSTARSVRVLWRAETDRKVMALTFDDGPGDKLTRPLLNALRGERVPATFSLVGREATKRRNIVKQQLTDGHELANHTWSHPDLSLLPLDELSRELERTDQLFYELSGKRPRFIRPPFGRVSGALLQHAAVNGQDVLLWDVRFKEASFDSAGNVTYVQSKIGPGSILLGHDAGRADRYIGTQAVPGLIREAKARGYDFVTASVMAELDAASRRT